MHSTVWIQNVKNKYIYLTVLFLVFALSCGFSVGLQITSSYTSILCSAIKACEL